MVLESSIVPPNYHLLKFLYGIGLYVHVFILVQMLAGSRQVLCHIDLNLLSQKATVVRRVISHSKLSDR